MEILYNIVIYPLVQIIEFVFVFIDKAFKETGVSIIAVSVAVSLLCLPLYNVAEKWQKLERDTQKKLKPKIDKIKAVFKGDEQYMMLSAYYRQNHYHPVYAMRNTFSLLIQIPFFIAAYTYLSHLGALQGKNFLFIENLGVPDALLRIGGGGGVNLLPVLMTLINVVSGAVYTKDLPFREKAQVYGMALIFLLLLYNSPAGLVLYWTMNNVFSLIKNCLKKTKYSKVVLYYFFIAAAAALDIYILFMHSGRFHKRVLVAAVIGICLVSVLLTKHPIFRKFISSINFNGTAAPQTKAFINSAVILFLLSGLAIPGALIASSTAEFSFISPYTSPLPFIGAAMSQGMGFFLFWCPVIYFFFSKKVKTALSLALFVLSAAALIDTFVFPGDYGFITTTLIFSNTKDLLNPGRTSVSIVQNIVVVLLSTALCAMLALSKRKIIFYSLQAIMIISLSAFSIGNIVKIQTEFSALSAVYEASGTAVQDSLKPVYNFSRNGRNVIVIMLDRAISGYVPYIFEEKPELLESFSGFTWYPNCVSLGGYTLIGVPALFGGYEYSPVEIQKQDDRRLLEKYNESLLVLPKLFSENGFRVTVTDPVMANFSNPPDLSIYDEYNAVHAENLHRRFLTSWQNNHPDIQVLSVSELLKNNLFHFSLFKMSPLLFRAILYNKGDWLVTKNFGTDSALTQLTLDNYSMLDALPKITVVNDSDVNTYTAMTNDLTHEPAFFQAPAYVPSNIITDKGSSPFAEETAYHANMAALTLLGKWFDYLKAEGVYDNSRIIIVSDHGWYYNTALPNNFTLPDGNSLVMFNPLLMIKDFSDGKEGGSLLSGGGTELKTDYTFISHADVPYMASHGITSAVNPFTLSPLFYDKSNGITITTVHKWEEEDTRKYVWKIRSDEWLHVGDNIFDPENWEWEEK